MRKKLGISVVLLVVVLVSAVAGAQIQQRFDDVPPDHYAYDAVEWAVEIGVTAGCGDGSNFCPNDKLSRAHMVTFLKRYHDWFISGTPSPPPDAPPQYPTYEAAVAAADAWYEEMERTTAGDNVSDWNKVAQSAADKAALWAGHDERADRLANETRILSRTGDLVFSNALGSLGEAKFYAAAAGYALAAAASAAALQSTSEREAAAAAAWSAAGAKLSQLSTHHSYEYITCTNCTIGGYEGRHRSGWSEGSGSRFYWKLLARDKAATARNFYFEDYA